MGQTITCMKCGAVVDVGYQSRHNSFHSALERQLREVEEEARRARRDSRR